jgi:type IV pilus assembly protein PilM
MLRALVREEGPEETTVCCELGDVTNLAVSHGGVCEFARVATFGVEEMARRLAERRQLTLDHARQWLSHVGLENPVEAIEGAPEIVGATREVLAEGARQLGQELRVMTEYYGRDERPPIDVVVACGIGSTIPGLVACVARELGQPIEVRSAPALERFGPEAGALNVPFGVGLES